MKESNDPLRKAANLLNKQAPKGEELAYINKQEAQLLKAIGGAGVPVNSSGVKSYIFNKSSSTTNVTHNNDVDHTYNMYEPIADQQPTLDKGYRREAANQLISAGKGKIFDTTNDSAVQKFLKSKSGQYMDPFPDYLRPAGDFLINDINNTANNLQKFIGSSTDRMNDFSPVMDQAKESMRYANDAINSMYDGRLQNKLEGFNSQSDAIANRVKDLNNRFADTQSRLQRGVLDTGDRYATALGDSVRSQVDYANRRYDELDRVPGLIRDRNQELRNNILGTQRAEEAVYDETAGRMADTRDAMRNLIMERSGRFADTQDARVSAANSIYDSQLSAADQLLDAEMGSAGGIRDAQQMAAEGVLGSELGAAKDLRDTQALAALGLSDAEFAAASDKLGARRMAANNLSDAEFSAAEGMLGAQGSAASDLYGARIGREEDIYGAQQSGSDRILEAERLKALAAGANAERVANADQRGLRTALGGQGTGTIDNMGNAMIRSQLGAARSDALADALIRDAERRTDADVGRASRMGDAGVGLANDLGQAGVGFADTTGQSSINRAQRLGDADVEYSDVAGQSGINLAQRLGQADVMLADRSGQSDINFAREIGDSNVGFSQSAGDAAVNYADTSGQAGIGRAGAIGDAAVERAGKMEDNLYGQADLDYAQKLEGINRAAAGLSAAEKREGLLDTDADIEGANIAADRYKAIGDINPGMADVYEQEARLGTANTALAFGDPSLTAEGQNYGIDQTMLDADQDLFTSVMNQQLANQGMITSGAQQAAFLPSMMSEAAFAPTTALNRQVSPYTSTGTLPSHQMAISSAPYQPATTGTSGKKNWVDHLASAGDYYNKGMDIFNDIKGLM